MKRSLSKWVVGIVVGLVLLIALPALAEAAPDVTVTSVTISGADAKVNQQSTAYATIKNIGDTVATGVWAQFAITSGSISYTPQNITGMAVEVNETRQVSIQWTPVTTGTHTISVTAGSPSDTNKTNDNLAANVSVVSSGLVVIKNFFVTPTILVDENGCAVINPVEISGYVQEDDVGTSDLVLIYLNGQIVSTVTANATQEGLFLISTNEACFNQPGEHTISAEVVRGNVIFATASSTIDVYFWQSGGGGDGSQYQNLVDVEALPRILRLGAGEFSEYLLSIKNLGMFSDTYEIKINSQATVDTWIDLESDIITVAPGQTKYLSLFVDLPRDASAGSYPINVIVEGTSTDIDRLYLVVQNDQTITATTSGGVKPDYAVDIEVAPAKLDVEAGESGEYIVTVRNIGKKTDTYDLNVLANSKILSWFDLEHDSITLAAGERHQLKLFVDVPDDVPSKSYPVSVSADGAAIDTDRVSISTIKKSSGFDVEVGKTTVSPQTIASERGIGVAVKATVSFTDLREESTGEYASVRLYVDGKSISTQRVYIPSRDAKIVSFTLDTGSEPMNAEPGEYNVYVVATVGDEVDRGQSAKLTIVRPGAVAIPWISVKELNVTANSEASLTITIKNTDIKDNTYTISAESIGNLAGKVEASPSSVMVAQGDTVSREIKLKIGNAKDDSYPVKIRVKADASVAEKSVTVNVKGGQKAEPAPITTGNETATLGYGAGAVIASTGGVLAAVIGAVLITLLYIGYYQTGHPLGLFRKKKLEEGGEIAIIETIKKEMPKKPQVEKPIVWQSTAPRASIVMHEKAKGEWPAEEAEKVLLNLESIRDQFKKTADEAGKVKERLSTLAAETAETIAGKPEIITE